MVIKIKDKAIGKNEPCFIIAEIGINHNNSIEIAKKMIDAASDAKCDAVKFQAFKAKRMYPKTAGTIDWKDNKKEYSYNIFESNKKYEIPNEWWKHISEYARSKNLIFFASICDEETGDQLIDYFDMVKATSFSITHIPLLKHIAKYNKPIIFSTGTADLSEIKEAYDAISEYNNQIIIMHCISQYPAPLNQTNMITIDLLKKMFPKASIGFSDHSKEVSDAPVAAIVYGAESIEKHITLDRNMEGPDHFFALEPNMVKEMVSSIRKTEEDIKKGKSVTISEKIIGSKSRILSDTEKYLKTFARRSVMTTKKLLKDHILQSEDIIILRNGKKKPGLDPKWQDIIIKKKYKLAIDVEPEHPLQEKDIILLD